MKKAFSRVFLTGSLIGVIAALAVVVGCGRLFARQILTEGLALEALPQTEDWEKGIAGHVSADGKTVWMSYYPRNGAAVSDWKGAIWTANKGIRASNGNAPSASNLRALMEAWTASHADEIAAKLGQVGKDSSAWATDITPDGSVVIGCTDSKIHGYGYSFVWREDIGAIFLNDFVAKAGIKAPDSLQGQAHEIDLFKAGGISADGTTIVGGEKVIWRLYNPKGFGKSGPLPDIDFNELRLEGTVKSVTKGHLVMSVSSITTPGGKKTVLSPTRDKVIVLVGVATSIKSGTKVAVTGADAGKGKPLTARSVSPL